MNVFDYQSIGNFPLAPIIPVKITPPSWSEYQGDYVSEAFLDTGSDCTLVPLEILSALKLKVVANKVPITVIRGISVMFFLWWRIRERRLILFLNKIHYPSNPT
jgi:hypothetical protein